MSPASSPFCPQVMHRKASPSRIFAVVGSTFRFSVSTRRFGFFGAFSARFTGVFALLLLLLLLGTLPGPLVVSPSRLRFCGRVGARPSLLRTDISLFGTCHSRHTLVALAVAVCSTVDVFVRRRAPPVNPHFRWFGSTSRAFCGEHQKDSVSHTSTHTVAVVFLDYQADAHTDPLALLAFLHCHTPTHLRAISLNARPAPLLFVLSGNKRAKARARFSRNIINRQVIL